MKFSVIMPSYLGEYRTAAKDRDRKILRAINSVICQTFPDWELIVIADGCEKTVSIVSKVVDERVRCIYIERNKLWGNEARNAGIDNAKGDYIIYLDIDDLYGSTHLENVNAGLKSYDWVWFDDNRYSPRGEEWYVNVCDIIKAGKHGTSNICHKRTLKNRWKRPGYAHDHYFIRELRENINYTKIPGGEYYVCHIPDSNIGKGYDL